MDSAEHAHSPGNESSLAHEPAADTASLGELARDTSDYFRAWSVLLASETRLARASMIRLGFAALVFPVLALGIWVIFDAFSVAMLDRWLHDWGSCLAIVLCANLVALYGLLVAMRHWWRNLSLPRSRGALAHLLERMG